MSCIRHLPTYVLQWSRRVGRRGEDRDCHEPWVAVGRLQREVELVEKGRGVLPASECGRLSTKFYCSSPRGQKESSVLPASLCMLRWIGSRQFERWRALVQMNRLCMAVDHASLLSVCPGRNLLLPLTTTKTAADSVGRWIHPVAPQASRDLIAR